MLTSQHVPIFDVLGKRIINIVTAKRRQAAGTTKKTSAQKPGAVPTCMYLLSAFRYEMHIVHGTRSSLDGNWCIFDGFLFLSFVFESANFQSQLHLPKISDRSNNVTQNISDGNYKWQERYVMGTLNGRYVTGTMHDGNDTWRELHMTGSIRDGS
jgi:hypothetical protein